MSLEKTYRLWCEQAMPDQDSAQELRQIAQVPDQIEDHFCQYLAFGTGGLRGDIGAGINCVPHAFIYFGFSRQIGEDEPVARVEECMT